MNHQVDPRKYVVEEQQEVTAGQMFKNLAAGFLIYSVGSALAGRLTGGMVKGVSKLLPKRVGKHLARQKFVSRAARGMTKEAARGASATLGDLIMSSSKPMRRVASAARQAFKPYRATLRNIRVQTLGRRVGGGISTKTTKLSQASKLQRWNYLKATIGSPKAQMGIAEEFMRRYIPATTTFYGIERLTRGKLTHETSDDYNPPPLWNVPAVAVDYAKFMVKWLPSDVMFAGMGRVFGSYFSVLGGKAVGNMLKPGEDLINRTIKKASEFARTPDVQRIVGKVGAHGQALAAISEYINTGKLKPVMSEAVQVGKGLQRTPVDLPYAYHGSKRRWDSIKNVYSVALRTKTTKTLADTPVGEAFRQVAKIAQHTGKVAHNPLPADDFMKAARAIIKPKLNEPSESLIAQALKWTHARVGRKNVKQFLTDTMGDEALKQLGGEGWSRHVDRVLAGAATEVKNPALDFLAQSAEKAFIGGGIYRTKYGTTLNMSRFKPLELAKTVTKFGLNIPFAGKLSLGSLCKLDNMLNKKVKDTATYILSPKESSHVPNPMTKKWDVVGAGIPGDMDARSWNIAGFINGEVVAYDKTRGGWLKMNQAGAFTKWGTERGLQVSLIPEAAGGDLHFAVDAMSGHLQKNMNELRARGIVGEDTGLFKRFLQSQELGMGNERSPDWVTELIRKLRKDTGGPLTHISRSSNLFTKLRKTFNVSGHTDKFRNDFTYGVNVLQRTFDETTDEAFISVYRNLDQLAKSTKTQIRSRRYGGLSYTQMWDAMHDIPRLEKYTREHISLFDRNERPWYSAARNVLSNMSLKGRKSALEASYGKGATNMTGADQLRKVFLFDHFTQLNRAGGLGVGRGPKSPYRDIVHDIFESGSKLGAEDRTFIQSMELVERFTSDVWSVPDARKWALGEYTRKAGTRAGDTPEVVKKTLDWLGRDQVGALGRLADAMKYKGHSNASFYRNYIHPPGEVSNVPFIVVPEKASFIDGRAALDSARKFLPNAEGRVPIWDAIREKGWQEAIRDEVTLFNPVSKTAVGAHYMMTRFFDIMERGTPFGAALAFDKAKWNTPASMAWAGIGRRILQFGAVATAWNMADTFVDVNPLFEKIGLDEGLNVAAAEQIAKVRLASARLADVTGVTGTFKYLEGLMPGSTTFIPGAAIGAAAMRPRGIGMMAFGALAGGFANRLTAAMAPYPDLTKSYNELREEYSGRERVPIYENYLFGRNSMNGDVKRYGANWFHRIKSRYKYSPDMYGSPVESALYRPWPIVDFNPIGLMLGGAYHYESKHFQTRPYPVSSPAFSEMPILGPFLGGTIGRIIKPSLPMHQEEMQRMIAEDLGAEPKTRPYFEAFPASARGNVGGRMNPPAIQRTPEVPTSRAGIASDIFYRSLAEPSGLPGYAAQLALGSTPFADDRILATSAPLTSMRRQYWNMNLGDFPLGSGELFRRLYPKDPYKNRSYNPLKNKIAHWLKLEEGEEGPRFETGDPYSAIVGGEERIPGSMYESLWDVKHTFPTGSSMLGKPIEDQVEVMLGIKDAATLDEEDIMEQGTEIHRHIQQMMISANLAAKAEARTYDPVNDVGGYVDMIMNAGALGKGQSPVEIKTVSEDGLARLNAPRFSHRSQLNHYLKELGMYKGGVLYVSRDDPKHQKYFPVNYSAELESYNMQQLNKARAIAGHLMGMGFGYKGGESYSRLDRMRVLGDVVPYSKTYKTEVQNVRDQIQAGLLSEEDVQEFHKIQKHRRAAMQTHQMYPSRFSIKGIIHPDKQYQLMSQNENIKAAAEYSLPERILGGAWQAWSSMDTPLHQKLLNYKSPIDTYEKQIINQQQFAGWDNPIQNFFRPYYYGLRGSTGVGEGALSFGMGGFLLGGPFGAALGAGVGAVYGGVHGAYRTVSGSKYIPSGVDRLREATDYFDKLKYIKFRRLYDLTGEREYAQRMSETMTGLDPEAAPYADIYKAVAAEERPYIQAFSTEMDDDRREEIAKMVSPGLRNILEIRWAKLDGKIRGKERDRDKSQELATYYNDHYLPPPSWVGFCVPAHQELLWGKEIRKIRAGENLHNGKEIHSVFSRTYLGPMVELKVKGSTETMSATPNHLIYKGEITETSPKKMTTIKRNGSWYNYYPSKQRDFPIGKLKEGDWIARPKPKLTEAVSEINIDSVINFVIHNTTSRHRNNTTNMIMKLDKDCGFFWGLWLAEGHVIFDRRHYPIEYPTGMGFTFGPHEMHLAKFCQDFIKEKFNLPSQITKRDRRKKEKFGGRSIEVQCGHIMPGTLAFGLFGARCDKKYISNTIMNAPKEFLHSLVKGIFEGDGCISKKAKTVRLGMTSKKIINNVREILFAFGVPSTVYTKNGRNYPTKKEPWRKKQSWHLCLTLSNWNHFLLGSMEPHMKANRTMWIDNDYLYFQIEKINTFEYSGIVYDLHIPDGHHYDTWIGSYHNSPETDLDDVELKTFRRMGLDAHRVGLGWQDQEMRVQNSPWLPPALDPFQSNRDNPGPLFGEVDRTRVNSVVQNVLRSYGLHGAVSVRIVAGGAPSAEVDLSITRDTTEAVRQFMTSGYGMAGAMARMGGT